MATSGTNPSSQRADGQALLPIEIAMIGYAKFWFVARRLEHQITRTRTPLAKENCTITKKDPIYESNETVGSGAKELVFH